MNGWKDNLNYAKQHGKNQVCFGIDNVDNKVEDKLGEVDSGGSFEVIEYDVSHTIRFFFRFCVYPCTFFCSCLKILLFSFAMLYYA